MAATNPPFGIQHLTVVPANFEPPVDDDSDTETETETETEL